MKYLRKKQVLFKEMLIMKTMRKYCEEGDIRRRAFWILQIICNYCFDMIININAGALRRKRNDLPPPKPDSVTFGLFWRNPVCFCKKITVGESTGYRGVVYTLPSLYLSYINKDKVVKLNNKRRFLILVG